MPDGEMRRPPQLWEQRLARQTAILSVGVSSNGDATSIVPPQPTPGTDGGIEPAPVLPPPGDFIAPSQPTLLKQVQAINVLWDGLNADGELWPYDTSWVEIHMSTTSGFTPSSTTLKGRLARPGIYSVGGLTSGTTYYFKLRGADPAGNVTNASTQASSTTGSATSSDIVSVTADKITAGTVTGLYIAGGTIAGGYLSGGTISGGYITGGTIDGASLRTASSGARVEMGAAFSSLSAVSLYNSSGLAGAVLTNIGSGLAVVAQTGTPIFMNGSKVEVNPLLECNSNIIGDAGLSIAGQEVDMAGVYANNTTGIDQVGIGASNSRLRRISSSQAIKYDIATLAGELSTSVEPARLCDVSTVDPQSVLDVAVTEFSVIDAGEPTERRVLGFIADDVADKLPIAATYYPDGTAAGVQTDAMVAALLAVVKDQQAAISDLRARIEALEA